MNDIDLSELNIGESAIVSGDVKNTRLADLGLIDGTHLKCVLKSPKGDPSAYLIRGAIIAIRKCDARHIRVNRAEEV